jgi:hypothetical protein
MAQCNLGNMGFANLCCLKQIALIIFLSRTSGYGTSFILGQPKISQMEFKVAP